MEEPVKYILRQGVYANWFAIPELLKEDWDRLMSRRDVYNYDGWDKMQVYKIDIETFTFENPIN